MKTYPIVAALLLLTITTPISAEAGSGQNLPDTDFLPYGFYTFRPDLRKCVSPLCGGIFVKAVNRKLTRCSDGQFQAECYVASLTNRHAIGWTEAALLQGRIKAKDYPGFGNLGAFVLAAAYRPATPSAGTGRFVGLENNGIVCITTPCFSTDQYWLNRNKTKEVSGIDLSQVEASDGDLAEAIAIMAEGRVLLASGKNQQIQEQQGVGIAFIANQIYLPIKPDANGY